LLDPVFLKIIILLIPEALDGRGLIPDRDKNISLYYTASRPNLVLDQPPILWVSGFILREGSRPLNYI
jgi:hypothetical protein